MKKILSRFILLAFVGTLLFLGIRTIGNTTKLSADSGFDASYDSGGSWGGGSYDSGSSWSSGSDYGWSSRSSSDSSYSGSYIECLIYMAIMFIALVSSAISVIGKGRNASGTNMYSSVVDSLEYSLYKIFDNVKYNLFLGKLDEVSELVTPELYDKLKADDKTKQKIITHDNTKILNKSFNNVVLQFINKIATYQVEDGKLVRTDEKTLDKMSYEVEFEKVSESEWKIVNIEEKFLQTVNTELPSSENSYDDFEIVDISKYIKDKDEFLKDRYNDYVAIQEAWMNFDYDTLKDKLTNELYNQYEMQLETLKAKNEKNVMKNFTNKGISISSVVEKNNTVTVNLSLHVTQIDYIEKDGECLRGNSGKLNNMHYNLTFISNLDDIEKKCPNCGNPLDDISTQTCKFCHSTISFTPKKWVMSKKQVRSQK